MTAVVGSQGSGYARQASCSAISSVGLPYVIFSGVNRDRLTACIVSLLFRQDAGIARDGKSLDRPLATDREIAMNANIGTIDRSLRIVGGLILIGLSLSGVIGLWGWIGIVPLATGIFRFCPLYALLGIKTCKRC